MHCYQQADTFHQTMWSDSSKRLDARKYSKLLYYCFVHARWPWADLALKWLAALLIVHASLKRVGHDQEQLHLCSPVPTKLIQVAIVCGHSMGVILRERIETSILANAFYSWQLTDQPRPRNGRRVPPWRYPPIQIQRCWSLMVKFVQTSM